MTRSPTPPGPRPRPPCRWPPPRAAAPETASSGACSPRSIVLKTVGKHLVLTGAVGARRGTLYAVYEFLERVVGVRWWTHTEEFVPDRPTLAVGPLDTRYKPPFLYREVFSWGMVPEERQWGYDDSDAAALDWAQAKFAARLRNNGHGTSMPASLGGCYMPLGWCHTFYPFLPPAKYLKDHPEWYSEIDRDQGIQPILRRVQEPRGSDVLRLGDPGHRLPCIGGTSVPSSRRRGTPLRSSHRHVGPRPS